VGEINKVFGRDFIIGFFLPALIFLVATFFLAKFLWPNDAWLQLTWHKAEDTGLFVFVAWVFAVLLESINREIFRTVEGYWPWGLETKLNRPQRKRFLNLKGKIDALRYKPGDLTANEERELTKLSLEMATKYPAREPLILPTSFGNAVRAYESYPRAIYGFESINGWTRLQALMTKDFRELLGNNRARVDFWLNVYVLTLLFAFEVAVAARIKQGLPLWLVPLIFLLALVAYVRARSSAQQFGEQVKAAFDVYLPGLAGKLGYTLSSDPEKNEKFWKAFSQVMVHRDPRALKDMLEVGLERVRSVAGASSDPVAEDTDKAGASSDPVAEDTDKAGASSDPVAEDTDNGD
jgi:hypothetical protein